MHAWSTMVRWEAEESPSLPGRCLFLTPCQSSEGLAEGKDPGDPGRTILSTEKAPGSGKRLELRGWAGLPWEAGVGSHPGEDDCNR